jgi:hypothetical protein
MDSPRRPHYIGRGYKWNCVNGHGRKKIGDPMAIDKNLIDQLLTDYKKPEDIIGENGLLKELTKATAGKDGS